MKQCPCLGVNEVRVCIATRIKETCRTKALFRWFAEKIFLESLFLARYQVQVYTIGGQGDLCDCPWGA